MLSREEPECVCEPSYVQVGCFPILCHVYSITFAIVFFFASIYTARRLYCDFYLLKVKVTDFFLSPLPIVVLSFLIEIIRFVRYFLLAIGVTPILIVFDILFNIPVLFMLTAAALMIIQWKFIGNAVAYGKIHSSQIVKGFFVVTTIGIFIFISVMSIMGFAFTSITFGTGILLYCLLYNVLFTYEGLKIIRHRHEFTQQKQQILKKLTQSTAILLFNGVLAITIILVQLILQDNDITFVLVHAFLLRTAECANCLVVSSLYRKNEQSTNKMEAKIIHGDSGNSLQSSNGSQLSLKSDCSLAST